MAGEFTLQLAELDSREGVVGAHSTRLLEDKYPELGFLFRELEELREFKRDAGDGSTEILLADIEALEKLIDERDDEIMELEKELGR